MVQPAHSGNTLTAENPITHQIKALRRERVAARLNVSRPCRASIAERSEPGAELWFVRLR